VGGYHTQSYICRERARTPCTFRPCRRSEALSAAEICSVGTQNSVLGWDHCTLHIGRYKPNKSCRTGRRAGIRLLNQPRDSSIGLPGCRKRNGAHRSGSVKSAARGRLMNNLRGVRVQYAHIYYPSVYAASPAAILFIRVFPTPNLQHWIRGALLSRSPCERVD
jgi:hypothetical protein